MRTVSIEDSRWSGVDYYELSEDAYIRLLKIESMRDRMDFVLEYGKRFEPYVKTDLDLYGKLST
jgi:hypothetical protein